MSTEFYCEEFPTEQNGKPVQTLKDLLEACPEDRFHFMTPFGYVDLNAQDAERLRQGAAMPAHAGESGWEIPIPAEKLLQQELVSLRGKAENGQWYAITTDPQPEMVGNRSRCRRCTCDRQPFPRRRARVGGLCGFPDTAERVPAGSHKTGRCAGVRELYGNGRHRRKPPAGGLRRREKPQAASRRKPRCRARTLADTSARSAGSLGLSDRGC